MKTNFFLLIAGMLITSALSARPEITDFSDVSSLANMLKSNIDIPTMTKANEIDGTVNIIFRVDKNQELQVYRIWSIDLPKNDVMEVEMQLINLEEKRIKYTGTEKYIPLKIYFKIW